MAGKEEGLSLDLESVVLGLYESSTSANHESEALRPGWNEIRLEYAWYIWSIIEDLALRICTFVNM